MCFSPTASFVTAGALTVIGGAVLKKIKNKKHLVVALVPIFFAIQQFSEGIVWITLDNPDYRTITTVATYIFIFFAFLVWPAYTPCAVAKVETSTKIKNRLKLFQALGGLVSFYLLIQVLRFPPTPEILGHSISYNEIVAYGATVVPLYVVATIGSTLLSSHRVINYYGIGIAIALMISAWSYFVTFTSAWCFFSAALSGIASLAWLKSQNSNA